MNTQTKIKLIETKIEEIKSLLETRTNQIANYHSALTQLTNQLNKIKKNIK